MTKLITEKERKHFEKIMESKDSPIQAGINRILVIQIREEDEVAEHIEIPGFQSGEEYVKQGSFIIPKSSKEKMKEENDVVKAVVISVGVSTDNIVLPFQPLDIVFVFPSVFETKMTFNGLDYFSYSQRDIVAIEPFTIDLRDQHMMD